MGIRCRISFGSVLCIILSASCVISSDNSNGLFSFDPCLSVEKGNWLLFSDSLESKHVDIISNSKF